MPHLLLAVTAHGYGHLAQSSPVVEALARRVPGLRVTLQSDIDPALARRRLPPGFTLLHEPADPGLIMDGPLVTRWEESLAAQIAFEADYERHLQRQLATLRDLAPDLVLADVPWLPLEAARRLGIPAVGLCSFTWYDILRECPLRDQVPDALLAHLRRVYAQADLFIRPVPAMAMQWLPNARTVGPIARRAPDRRAELRRRFGCPADRPLALMQFGGFEGLDPLRDWPEQDQVHWLVQDLPGPRRRDAAALGEHGLEVLDVLGSVDLILGKPGYGTYAEAACNGVPVLHLPREDWPEAAALDAWLGTVVPTRELSLADFAAGRVAEPIAALLAAGRPAPVAPGGIEESADLLEPWLRG
ncbi:hypothetical protein [Candidatus Thiodictyon syntrophicum]|jgi:hypothetical protein|uniref:Glycosyl transferase family 28 C-terminal domain-containing protein n=1 Tax=Candidatus Thiodictyon syntrophicum TaxID=1166950 RepID=A0A2K8U854_9GAMM|nr:hypothetical protein [Candidatus Thiodictyon syntrophicum]AUB81589.1 hypothetical protein THSYN_11890 [Candidatus Thiodictyon syntrophicum]